MAVLKRILSYLAPYRATLIVAYVCLFLALALQLMLPLVLQRAIDHGVIAGDMSYLLRACLIYLGLAVLQGLFTFSRAYLMNRLAEQVGYHLRDDLYRHLQRLPFSFYDRESSGQLMSRATDDINNIRGMLMMSLRTIPLIVCTLVAVTIILLFQDWKLTLLSMVVYPPLVFYSYRFGIGIRPLFAQVQQQFGVMTSSLQENIAGARVVRAFAQEQAEVDRFDAELRSLFRRNLIAARKWSFSYSLMVAVSGVGLVAVIWVGGLQVIDGALTVGALVAFNRYLTMLAEPIRWLGFLVNRIARAIASGDRIFTVLDIPPAIADAAGAIALEHDRVRGDVAFKSVSFTYAESSYPALHDVSFTVRPGQTVAIVGPTGSGKSTIAQLLPRFYDVSSGEITLDGHDIRTLTLASLRREIATVSQDTFLFGLPIRENIAFGRPDASLDEIIEAATSAGADTFIRRFPQGYDTVTGERGVSLSGGQRQRIAIARALLANPHVLILDDATSSVDSQTEATIQAALSRLRAGRASIVIAQRLDSIRDADEILVLEHGRITQRGTHEQLVSEPGFYRDLYDLQSHQRGGSHAADIVEAARAGRVSAVATE